MTKDLTFNFDNPAGARKPAVWRIAGKKVNLKMMPFIRKGLVDERTAALFMSHRVKVNPRGDQLKGLYGAPAADICGVLLATDADEIYMADLRKIDVQILRDALSLWGRHGKVGAEAFDRAFSAKQKAGLWNVNDFNALGEQLIIFELKALGVARDSVRIGVNSAGAVIIRFPWAYPGAHARQRVVTYTAADMTKKPGEQGPLLKKLLEPRGIDFYFQKAACNLIYEMEKYIPPIAEAASKFMLISPTVPYIHNLGIRSQLAEILRPKFALDPSVNDEFAKYFVEPKDWTERAHPYSWYLECWMRRVD